MGHPKDGQVTANPFADSCEADRGPRNDAGTCWSIEEIRSSP